MIPTSYSYSPQAHPAGPEFALLQADPFGPNPLVTDLSSRNQRLFVAASERSPAPTLFATGDLPPFTASGLEPAVLTRVAFSARHAMAAEPSRQKVLALVEESAGDPARMGRTVLHHVGLEEYRMRLVSWVSGIELPALAFEDAAYPDSYKTPRQRRADAAREAATR